MKWYITRRLAWAVVATAFTMTVTFLLMYLVPNQQLQAAEFAAAQSGADNITAVVEAEKERLGLDRSLHVQWWDFMTNIFKGDWGWSYQYQQPVRKVIFESAPYSLMYGAPAIILSTVIGAVIGLYSAVNQYTKKDYAATFAAFFGISIPNFWFGIILLVIFGGWLGWLPFGFEGEYAKAADGSFAWRTSVTDEHLAFVGESFEGERTVGILSWRNIEQLILPTFVVMTGAIASVMRFARAEALEYVDAEFVKTAKSKGVSTHRIVARHVFRPASVPLMTIFVGRVLGLVLFGSYLVELVFGIPGIGLASFEAILSQDTDLVAITILIPTFLVIIGNLIEDIMYVVLDPRIEFGDR
jgi:peptide/nickel transport system permease protein